MILLSKIITFSEKFQIRPVLHRIAFCTSLNKKGNNAYATNFANDSKESENKPLDEDQLDKEFVNSVMTSSLKYVNSHGWTMDAIVAGATDIEKLKENMSVVELATSMFSEEDLVRFFINKSNIELEQFLVANKVTFQDALEYRLHKVVPYAERYSEAIALSTQPKNIVQSVQQLQEIADAVAHHSLSDKSTDVSWYSKRVGLAAIYASTEVCLVQDKSADFNDTWSFLKRRCDDFESMKLNVGGSTNNSLPLPELISVGFTTVLNMLQRNPRR